MEDKKTNKRLRAKQIAEQNGVGLSTVWFYVKQKKLTPIKVSSRVTVFDAKEVDELFGGS